MKAKKGLIPSRRPRDIEEIENIGEPQISSTVFLRAKQKHRAARRHHLHTDKGGLTLDSAPPATCRRWGVSGNPCQLDSKGPFNYPTEIDASTNSKLIQIREDGVTFLESVKIYRRSTILLHANG